MAQSTRSFLGSSLVARYRQLRERLTSRLGSADLATEALHETWIKLQDGPDLAPVNDAEAYLFRAALNTASNLRASRQRLLDAVEIDRILGLADESPDPERVAIGRSELAALRKALNGLSPRQRHIFLECFTGDATHAELAEHYSVTIRTIQIELREAILHCARQMKWKKFFAPTDLRVSRK